MPIFPATASMSCGSDCREITRGYSIIQEKTTLESIASGLNMDMKDLRLLCDGDYCDPPMVVRLCRYLGLPLP